MANEQEIPLEQRIRAAAKRLLDLCEKQAWGSPRGGLGTEDVRQQARKIAEQALADVDKPA